ncbi:alpha/beta hydrolase, partial [Rivihabitans pingtungensis]
MTSLAHRVRLILTLLAALSLGLAACSPVALHAWWSESRARAQGFAPARLSLAHGGQLAYREAGHGPTLLLIHGFGGNGLLHWRRSMSELVEQYHVVTPDLLGFGDSHAPGPLTLDAQVDALIALIEARQLGEVRVAGISYGGFVALELARRLPLSVRRVVLINSPGPIYQAADL